MIVNMSLVRGFIHTHSIVSWTAEFATDEEVKSMNENLLLYIEWKLSDVGIIQHGKEGMTLCDNHGWFMIMNDAPETRNYEFQVIRPAWIYSDKNVTELVEKGLAKAV